MADIKAFNGVRYNTQKIKDLSDVMCPPYDIISPAYQDDLYKRSEYNFIRIEFNKETQQDTPDNNRYSRALGFMQKWLQEEVLKSDKTQAIYVHDHYFTIFGKQYKRRDILTLVKLEEWDTMVIRPHENIIPKAKSDRMNMLMKCHANTSQILGMYEDPSHLIAGVLESHTGEEPLFGFTEQNGDIHKMWSINQPQAIDKLHKAFSPMAIYIADGHHRYDSALTYKREMEKNTKIKGNEGFNYVLISLIDISDPGMVILPTHRLVRSIPENLLNKFKNDLTQYFEIRDISLDRPDAWQVVDSELTGISPDTKYIKMALYGLNGDNISILTLRDPRLIDKFMPEGHSDVYKMLDVSIVDNLILDKMLEFDKDKEEGALIYSHDRQETINLVKTKKYQMAFILNPVKPETIKAIADARDRMPRKSTYFYPKSPAGMVFYKW